jgi:cytochrome c biogenesis protein CcdA
LARLLALLVAIGAAAAVARAVVYGSGASALGGQVLVSAFVGGLALAFSLPFLLVLFPFLTVLFAEDTNAGPLASTAFLGTFALAFLVTISGLPGFIAAPMYQSEWLVDPAGGMVFVIWGLLSFAGLSPVGPLWASPSLSRRLLRPFSALVFGLSTGALMFHELDPAYDSVFFATANAVAASHSPVTVAVFTAGLGLTYLALARLTAAMASRVSWSRAVFAAGRMASGIATAVIGVAILTQRFDAIRGLLL